MVMWNQYHGQESFFVYLFVLQKYTQGQKTQKKNKDKIILCWKSRAHSTLSRQLFV